MSEHVTAAAPTRNQPRSISASEPAAHVPPTTLGQGLLKWLFVAALVLGFSEIALPRILPLGVNFRLGDFGWLVAFAIAVLAQPGSTFRFALSNWWFAVLIVAASLMADTAFSLQRTWQIAIQGVFCAFVVFPTIALAMRALGGVVVLARLLVWTGVALALVVLGAYAGIVSPSAYDADFVGLQSATGRGFLGNAGVVTACASTAAHFYVCHTGRTRFERSVWFQTLVPMLILLPSLFGATRAGMAAFAWALLAAPILSRAPPKRTVTVVGAMVLGSLLLGAAFPELVENAHKRLFEESQLGRFDWEGGMLRQADADRDRLLDAALADIPRNFPYGVGLGVPGSTRDGTVVHNIPVQLVYEAGVAGLALYLALVVLAIRGSLGAWNAGNHALFGLVVTSAAGYLGIVGLSHPFSFSRETAVPLMAILFVIGPNNYSRTDQAAGGQLAQTQRS